MNISNYLKDLGSHVGRNNVPRAEVLKTHFGLKDEAAFAVDACCFTVMDAAAIVEGDVLTT